MRAPLSPSLPSAPPDAALGVGARAPSPLLVDPLSGEPRPLLVPGRPTLVTFLRGTWCGDCRAFLERVGPLHAEVARRGVSLVGVVCQGRHWVASWLAVNRQPFPLLVDEERTAARAYGVYKLLGLDGVNIARPASFLVDASGRITWSYVGRDKGDRPSDALLLERIAQLGEAARAP
ncbi:MULTISPECIES: peroxiredoxin [Myxococcaceae]|uniref:peroxiredoxin family protein n=1 Tax=Myxococcaceae TaxID=31 RepID=UPI001890A0F6|nr:MULTISPECIES: redoxin domain-containing protein [Myxococcaceae]MBF5045337.1 redoxin domain-containing protein [Simulacricoccus sp. 17bor-14]